MGLFSRERKMFFKHKCADENGELIKQNMLRKVSDSDRVITAEMIATNYARFNFFIKVSKTTKVLIYIVPSDVERGLPFSDIKVIGFIHKKKSTDQEIEKISEWMQEFKILCDQMSKHNELLQKG